MRSIDGEAPERLPRRVRPKRRRPSGGSGSPVLGLVDARASTQHQAGQHTVQLTVQHTARGTDPDVGERVDLRTRSNGVEGRGESRVAPEPLDVADWAEVDGYQFHQLIRRTPSADVYLAYHRATRAYREVFVVQRLPGVDQPALRRAVEAEVAAARALHHPGVAPAEDVGLTRDGRLYVATARPVGRPLSELLAGEGALPVRRALHLGLAVVDVVAAAHDVGIVHGRLTPASVVVVPQQPGQPERAMVLGFGTAVAQDGTLVPRALPKELSPFVSPQRAAGAPAGPRDDVFGLGSVLMSMFIGGPPSVIRGSVGQAELPEPGAAPNAAPDAEPEAEPGKIIQVLRRARAADPERRHASAADLGAALRAINATVAEGPRVATPGAPAAVAAAVTRPTVVRPTVVPAALAAPLVRYMEAPLPVARAVPGPSAPDRRLRTALAAAGVAAAFAGGWAVRAWQRRSMSEFPSPPAEAARPVQKQSVASIPAPAGPAPVMRPAPDPALPPAPAPASRPAVAPGAVVSNTVVSNAVAPSVAPSRAERVENRPATPAARTVAALGRGMAAERRPGAAAPPVVATTRTTDTAPGGPGNSRITSAPAGTTASAAGEVAVARSSDAGAAGAASSTPVANTSAATEAASSAAGVRAAVAEYANAIEARDLGWLGRIYPGMTDTQRRAWATFFGSVADLRARLVIDDLTAKGATAQVRVRGTYEYQNLRPHRAERAPVRFTATLARDGAGWRVRTVE